MIDIMLWSNMLASWVRPMDVQHTRELKTFGMVLLSFGTQEKVWEGVRERFGRSVGSGWKKGGSEKCKRGKGRVNRIHMNDIFVILGLG